MIGTRATFNFEYSFRGEHRVILKGAIFSKSSYTMAPAPLAMRIMANSISIANQAGKIIRDIMSQGELGIIDKVRKKS